VKFVSKNKKIGKKLKSVDTSLAFRLEATLHTSNSVHFTTTDEKETPITRIITNVVPFE